MKRTVFSVQHSQLSAIKVGESSLKCYVHIFMGKKQTEKPRVPVHSTKKEAIQSNPDY